MNVVSDAELPYNGTEGYAGSDTSEERAHRDVVEGTASIRQRYVLIMAERAKEHGVTVAELRESSGKVHHGSVSGSLSVLHRAGKLARLKERRGGCKVYVRPEYVNGRETEPHGVVHKADRETLEAAQTTQDWLDTWGIGLSDSTSTSIQRLIDYANGRT